MNSTQEILIVEDSATQSLRLRLVLERHGFRVTAAGDGLHALAALAELRPAVILSDIQMPGMDGYELCRRVKSEPQWRDIPIMLLTSLSAPEDIIHGLACGADNFIVKPYEEAFLIARIQSVQANCALSRESDDHGGIEVEFAGQRYTIGAGRRQILNLLLSTYETAVKTNAELIEAHEALKAAQAQLIEAEKLQSVGRLAAGVAHEIRNPLAILEMGLSFLSDQVSGDGHVILGEMREATKRASVVVEGLMEITSPHQLGMHEGDLHAVLDRALAVLGDELARAGIEVVRDFAESLPASRIDEGKLGQVFLNIFTNALHAMPEGGTLTVSSRVQTLDAGAAEYQAGERSGARFREGEQAIAIEVRDTGTGIAQENLGKVFDPFFTTKPTGKGIGLGLTVARKIVELHRGGIGIRSLPGGGTSVSLMFRIV